MVVKTEKIDLPSSEEEDFDTADLDDLCDGLESFGDDF